MCVCVCVCVCFSVCFSVWDVCGVDVHSGWVWAFVQRSITRTCATSLADTHTQLWRKLEKELGLRNVRVQRSAPPPIPSVPTPDNSRSSQARVRVFRVCTHAYTRTHTYSHGAAGCARLCLVFSVCVCFFVCVVWCLSVWAV